MGMSLWGELKFMIVDGWHSRFEGRRVGPENMKAIRDASHSTGGPPGAIQKTMKVAAEENERYNASFEKD